MNLSSTQLREELKALWPDIVFPWLPDRTYALVPTSDVLVILEQSGVSTYVRTGELWDCDDYALAFNAAVKKWCWLNGMPYQAAFGECFATRLHGRELNHSLNINRDEAGWWLINNDAKTHWIVDNAKDYVALVRL